MTEAPLPTRDRIAVRCRCRDRAAREKVMLPPVTATIPLAKVFIAGLKSATRRDCDARGDDRRARAVAKRPIAPLPDVVTEPPLIVVVPPLLVLTPSASTPVVTMVVSVSLSVPPVGVSATPL